MSFPDGPGGGLTLAGIQATVPMRPDGSGWMIDERVAENGPESHVTFHVSWPQRGNFIRALLGTCINVGGTAVRVPAVAYPDDPTIFALQVTSMRGLRPIGGGPEVWPAHDLAEMTVVFGRPSWSVPNSEVFDESGKPYTTTRVRSSGEVYTPPAGAYWFEATGDQVEEASVGVMRARIEVNVTRHQMPPSVMIPILAAAQNKVNSAPITIGGYTFPEGYALFATGDVDIQADAAANVVQDFSCTILCQTDHEWNQFQAADGSWDYLNTKPDGTGDRPFAEADFWSQLFPDVS